jgi:hypothetical protein
MAVVTGTVQEVWGFQRPAGNSLHHTISSKEQELECCFVSVTFESGTYADADEAQFDPTTAIENSKRDGKTVAPLDSCCVRAGDENGSIVGASNVTISSDNVKCRLLQEDLSTERADGAMSSTWNEPIVFCVSYYAPINGE